MASVPAAGPLVSLFIWLAACGFAADWAGFHFMVVRFSPGRHRRGLVRPGDMDSMRHHVLLAIMPVFFLSTGLRTNWGWAARSYFRRIVLLLASDRREIGRHPLAGKILGWDKGEASIIGWLLQTKALIMIIFVNILLDKHIITSATFTALLLMAIASTMLTVPMVYPKLQRLKSLISKT